MHPALLILLLQLSAATPPGAQDAVDPDLRAAIQQFFAAQQAEDVAGYLILWSGTAERPKAFQLESIYKGGDDRFSDVVIERVTTLGAHTRVRVGVTRARTVMRPDGRQSAYTMRLAWSLTYVREADAWKIVREGTPHDDLAAALLAAATEGEREALLASDSDVVNERLLDAIARGGDAEAQAGRHAAAEQSYLRGLEIARRIGSRRMEGRALQNLGTAMYFQRNYPRALQMFEARLVIEREAVNDEGVASALSGIGSVQYALFEYGAALQSYREAAAILERLGDGTSLAAALISTGNLYYLQGDLPSAIADYTRSREHYRRLAYTAGEARALEGLGLAFAAQGNYASALEAYAGVLQEGRARSDARAQATAHASIGEIHFVLGNLDAARAQFASSRAFYEQMKDLANAGQSWQATAVTELVAGRFADAEQGYAKGQTLCAAAGDRPCVARATVGLAFAQSSQELYDKAIAMYGKAIDAFTKLAADSSAAADARQFVEEAARAEIGLAQALNGKKNHEAAFDAAARALGRAIDVSNDDVRWRALAAQARALRRMGETTRALAAAETAVAIVERLRDGLTTRPNARVAADTTAAFAIVAVLHAEAGNAVAASHMAERRRAHALRLALAMHERSIHRGTTAQERDDEQALAGQVAALQLQRDKQQALPKPDAVQLARLDAAISDATAKRAAQHGRLFERLPDLRRWRGLEPAVPADAISKILSSSPETLLLEFVVDDDDVLVFATVSGDGRPMTDSHVVPLSRQQLAERVAALHDAAALREIGAWRKSAATLAAVLPDAVVATLNTTRDVVIIPDDVLWRVPFDALPVKDGFLIDHAAVTYTGSLAALALERQDPSRTAVRESTGEPATEVSGTPEPALLAVGAPVLSAALRDRVRAVAPYWAVRSTDAAHREVAAAAAVYEDPAPIVQSGAAATEAAFRAAAGQATVLHIAAPFRTNAASPLFSQILLSTPEPAASPESAADGMLESREMMNLELDARAAVLTDGMALSMRNAAGAVPVLQWTWLAAGVPALILSRWAADEQISRQLVSDLHARMEAGAPPAEALRAARLKVRRAEATSPPLYWAGWMAVGR